MVVKPNQVMMLNSPHFPFCFVQFYLDLLTAITRRIEGPAYRANLKITKLNRLGKGNLNGGRPV
jgi:hypothetical protein